MCIRQVTDNVVMLIRMASVVFVGKVGEGDEIQWS